MSEINVRKRGQKLKEKENKLQNLVLTQRKKL